MNMDENQITLREQRPGRVVRLWTHLSYTERLLTLSFSGSTIFRQIKKNKERVNREN